MMKIANTFMSINLQKFKSVTGLGLAASAIFWHLPSVAAADISQNQYLADNSSPLLLAQANILFVNSRNGKDTPNNGSQNNPLKTITYALSQATANTMIILAPGIYNSETGEIFPLKLKSQVTIQGDRDSRGNSIIINGGGTFISPTFASQNITILAENQAVLTGVTVTNPNDRGYGLWIESSSPMITNNTFISNTHDGISVTGSSAPIIRGNYFAQNGANGITIYGTSQAELRDNVFEKTGYGINIAQNGAPILIGNRIIQNRSGIVAQGNARPILRNNIIEGNLEDGLVTIANAQPDVGTSKEEGGNIFRNNRRLDINAKASRQIIPAFGNQLSNSRLEGRVDLSGRTDLVMPLNNISSVPQSPPNISSLNLPNVTVIPASPGNSGDAINIRVPPPNSINRSTPLSVNSIASRPPLASAGNTQINSIQIPVPTPQAKVVSPSPDNITDTNGSKITPELPKLAPGLLPVPGPVIPASSSGTSTFNNNNSRSGEEPPPPPNRANMLGLRYRVIVEANSARDEAKVRSLVPDAFRRIYNGREVMQVGAYKQNEQEKANRMLENMIRNGFRATIEELN